MRRYLWFALLFLPFLLAPFPFYLTLLTSFAIAALVALSLYVLTGLGGMTSFAQAAFMGVAAYATALHKRGRVLADGIDLARTLVDTRHRVTLVAGPQTFWPHEVGEDERPALIAALEG